VRIMTEPRNALSRQFREIFREETAHTVAAAEDVEEELRHLLSAMAE